MSCSNDGNDELLPAPNGPYFLSCSRERNIKHLVGRAAISIPDMAAYRPMSDLYGVRLRNGHVEKPLNRQVMGTEHAGKYCGRRKEDVRWFCTQ